MNKPYASAIRAISAIMIIAIMMFCNVRFMFFMCFYIIVNNLLITLFNIMVNIASYSSIFAQQLTPNKFVTMKAVKLSSLKKGDFFTLKPIENPYESQVLISDGYDRSLKKYECHKFSDICAYRFYSGVKIVYVDFYF